VKNPHCDSGYALHRQECSKAAMLQLWTLLLVVMNSWQFGGEAGGDGCADRPSGSGNQPGRGGNFAHGRAMQELRAMANLLDERAEQF
jgi:hypothetical protein